MRNQSYPELDYEKEDTLKPLLLSPYTNLPLISDQERVVIGEWHNNRQFPKFTKYLLYFLPKKDREPLLGDLKEEYREIYEKFGKRKARFWYYCQIAMSFWLYMACAIKKLFGLGAVS